jgi:hypothetical protein
VSLSWLVSRAWQVFAEMLFLIDLVLYAVNRHDSFMCLKDEALDGGFRLLPHLRTTRRLPTI